MHQPIPLTAQQAAELHGAVIRKQKSRDGAVAGWAQGVLHVVELEGGRYSVSAVFQNKEARLTKGDLDRMVKQDDNFLLELRP